MASKLTNGALLKTAARSFAAQAATAQSGGAAGALRIEQAKTGATVISVDRNEPLSRVGVFLKAGARFSSVAGASHIMQHLISGGLSTPQRTGLNMVRTTEQLGAAKLCTVGREVTAYRMASCRDCVDEVLSVLSSLTGNNGYMFHEYPTDLEVGRLRASLNISAVEKTLDLAIKAAFRAQSLGNSLYVPEYNIENISVHEVNDLISATHGSSGLVIVGSGIDHDVLYASASAMGLQDGGVASVSQAAKFLGGDMRVETGGSNATVVVLGEGAKYGSAESLALQVAAKVLGSGSSAVSFGVGSNSVLTQALKGTAGATQGHSLTFSDSGVFGFSLQTSASAAPKAVSSLVSAVKNLSAGEKDVSLAKAAVIADILQSGHGCDEVASIGEQMLMTGNYVATSDAVRAVDAVTPAAVNKAIAKAFSGKLAVASLGNINDVPYADSL